MLGLVCLLILFLSFLVRFLFIDFIFTFYRLTGAAVAASSMSLAVSFGWDM